jgi:hypothetical protein
MCVESFKVQKVVGSYSINLLVNHALAVLGIAPDPDLVVVKEG